MNPVVGQQTETPLLHNKIMQNGVLVVDDSDLQRLVAVEMLRHLGIGPIYEAVGSAHALTLLEQDIQPAVMLVDLHMPGMDGIELIQEVANTNPQIALVIVSGADSKLLDTLGCLVSACKMSLLGALPKPLNGQALLRSLQRYPQIKPFHPPPDADASPSALALKRAIRLGQIHPFYQPKVSLKLGHTVGFEALARWCDPTTGIILPCQFIELADDSGQLKELTLNLLDSVLADMNAWNHLEIFPVISLNLAANLLEDRNFANQIIRSVKNANISPTKILFELTESVLMKDQALALATIGRLKLNGFRFSIDDYGTGFSSIQQLSRIAFDELKIDRSFISHIHESEHLRNIVESVLDMSRRLGLTTIAEGVETIEELTLLRAMGCDEIQGYLFARPMPASDVLLWLNDNALTVAALCRGQP